MTTSSEMRLFRMLTFIASIILAIAAHYLSETQLKYFRDWFDRVDQ